MKITSKILSIPPYLSTTWKNISSLHAEEAGGHFTLIVLLQNRTRIEVPDLDKATVAEIFEAHTRYAETEQPSFLQSPYSFSLPLKSDGSLEVLNSSLQHNAEQANLPVLPPEVLKKITAIARAFGLEDTSILSPPELNCNCMYCQIARFLFSEKDSEEEIISEEDLKFRNWDISQIAEKLYLVTNPFDKNEHYNVFLGEPLGCTCGQKSCEHIRAVLNT